MSTKEQVEAFRQALIHARNKSGWSQRRLARELKMSHSAVSSWERGDSLPEPAHVVDLERVLELEAGALSRLIGYMPAATMREEMVTVLNAIMADPDLGPQQRDLLLTIYRQLVEQRRTELIEREALEDSGGDLPRKKQGRS